MRKILFLDIDGVLNSLQHAIYCKRVSKSRPHRGEFCPICSSNLNYLIEEISDLEIVISSSWRKFHSFENLMKIFKDNNINTSKIVGYTPILKNNDGRVYRGEEIMQWLQNNGLSKYDKDLRFAILDDDQDMLGCFSHLFYTNHQVGFQFPTALKLIEFFN